MKQIEKEIITDETFDIICKYIEIRNKSNMSQRDLARKVGVSHTTISRMEKNMHSISLGTFVNILSKLDYKLKIVNKEV